MAIETDYERVELSSRLVNILQMAGLDMVDEAKVQRFVNEMVDDQDKVHEVKESHAVKVLVYFFENEADMDDLAREYSRVIVNGKIRIVRESGDRGGPSDVYMNGERVQE